MYQENSSKFFTINWNISATEYYSLQIGTGGGVKDVAVFHFYPGGFEKLVGFNIT